MNPAHQRWISRKEIAALTGFTVHRIRRNEENLGLSEIKVVLNPRTVLYHRTEALVVLKPFIEICNQHT
jgi:hypothetical protein